MPDTPVKRGPGRPPKDPSGKTGAQIRQSAAQAKSEELVRRAEEAIADVTIDYMGTAGDCNKPGSLKTISRINRILRTIAEGNSRRAAARAHGVNEHTFYSWVEKDPELATLTEQAESVAEIACISVIKGAALQGNWQAAAWWLQRCGDERYKWTEYTKQETTVKHEGPVKVQLSWGAGQATSGSGEASITDKVLQSLAGSQPALPPPPPSESDTEDPETIDAEFSETSDDG